MLLLQKRHRMQHCNTAGQCTLATDVINYDRLRPGTHVPGTYKNLCDADPFGVPSTDCKPQKLCDGLNANSAHDHASDDHDIYHHIRHGDNQSDHHGHNGIPFWGNYPHKNMHRYPHPPAAVIVNQPWISAKKITGWASEQKTNWPLIFIGIGVLAFLIKRRK